jgi:hypothetical protein
MYKFYVDGQQVNDPFSLMLNSYFKNFQQRKQKVNRLEIHHNRAEQGQLEPPETISNLAPLIVSDDAAMFPAYPGDYGSPYKIQAGQAVPGPHGMSMISPRTGGGAGVREVHIHHMAPPPNYGGGGGYPVPVQHYQAPPPPPRFVQTPAHVVLRPRPQNGK